MDMRHGDVDDGRNGYSDEDGIRIGMGW